MAHIYICFVWHMHQPFYKDLVSGEYKLPWTRMHALKDYYGMVKVLEDFPEVHQTFNLVPSLLVQIEEYARGEASDPFLRIALKPAESLLEHERAFVLQYFFQANTARMIGRYPRYAELHRTWEYSRHDTARASRMFGTRDFRDLQVLSQLAWFDEEFLTHDPDLRDLVRRGKDYTLDDQRLIGNKEIEAVGKVIPVYRDFAARGQIEISTTPFYHPILPLLCDSNIAEASHPHVPLPSRFRYPQDARHQLNTARSYVSDKLGVTAAGLWPSEGSVSDEALHLAAEAGFNWFATDNGVLGRTLQTDPGPSVTYKPYVWRQGGKELRCIFRDHYLSDLIGFVYSRMGAAEAANHFLSRIRENCSPMLHSGRDVLAPIILDGENAWEYYEESGREFLRELYKGIAEDKRMTAVTVSEALAKIEPQPLDHIFPGSWINANFDIWIGAEEDNKAWEFLLRTRETYERVIHSPDADLPEDRLRLAYEELLIAEGSDWCWWYGPEHDSANRPEFDQLFRDHLANVYLALRISPPEELSRPILRVSTAAFHQPPSGPVKALIDGEVTSYFEWLGAGVYRVDNRSGAMHGKRFFVRELRYGSDGQNLFLRLDLVDNSFAPDESAEIRINVLGANAANVPASLAIRRTEPELPVEARLDKIWEIKIPLSAVAVSPGHNLRFQLSLWVGGLPMDALPPQGWIEFSSAEPVDWVI